MDLSGRKLFIIYFLLSCPFIFLAIFFAPWGLFALYPACSFITVSFAYITDYPEFVGWKNRRTGNLNMIFLVGLLPFYALVWSVWFLRSRTSGEPVYQLLSEGLYLGRFPLKVSELPPDIKVIIDLTAEFGSPTPFQNHGKKYICVPALDTSSPHLSHFQVALKEILTLEGPFLIHCANGHGRSAMMMNAVMCCLGRAEGIDDALSQMKSIRPSVHIRPNQREILAKALQGLLPNTV